MKHFFLTYVTCGLLPTVVLRYKITYFFLPGRNIKPTARGNPRLSISYHGNVTLYFMHIAPNLALSPCESGLGLGFGLGLTPCGLGLGLGLEPCGHRNRTHGLGLVPAGLGLGLCTCRFGLAFDSRVRTQFQHCSLRINGTNAHTFWIQNNVDIILN